VVGVRSVFWDDLAGDIENPQFLREFIAESVRIATVDSVINALDAARVSEGLSKAELARAIGTEPATIRRLFTVGLANPTLGTLAAVAAALGLRIGIEPIPEAERDAVTRSLRDGTANAAAMKRLRSMRKTSGRRPVRL